MSFDVSALPAYTEQNAMDIIVKSVAEGQLSKYAQIQPGVKGPTTINILDTDVVFQADGCSRSASGTTTLTQRTITPGAIAVHEDLCMTDLAAKYTAVMLKQGLTAEKESVPFEEIYFAQKIAKVQDALGKAYWQGDTASGSANLNKFDGLDKQILAAGTAVNGNPTGITTGTGYTAANIISILLGMAELTPEAIAGAEDLKLFVAPAQFLLYQRALADGNYFHYVSEGQVNSMPLIGFPNIEVVSDSGLTALGGSPNNNIYSMRASNIHIGVDLPDEEANDVRSWYDQNDRIYKVTMAFRTGVNVAFPDEIVRFALV
jgi:hypothetical protein